LSSSTLDAWEGSVFRFDTGLLWVITSRALFIGVESLVPQSRSTNSPLTQSPNNKTFGMRTQQFGTC
jgi:hypothetical protein